MSYSLHIRNFRMPAVDQSHITEDQITYFSVIELPFRLRLGRYSRTFLSPNNTDEIAWLNRVDLPKLSGYKVEDVPLVRDRHLLNTRLIVIENAFSGTAEEIVQLRQSEPFPLTTQATDFLMEEPGTQLLSFPKHDKTLSLIRRFLDLYGVVA